MDVADEKAPADPVDDVGEEVVDVYDEKLDSQDTYLDTHDETDEETDNLLKKGKSSSNDCIPLIPQEQETIVIYKQRWLMLLIFSLNTAMNGCLFMSLSPINDIVKKYYQVTSVNIEWLSNMCVLTYIFLALPSSYFISKCGIRPMIITATCLNFAATALNYFGYARERYWLILFGQAFVAIAYSMILQMPGKISSMWFPEEERCTATAIAVVMNLFGVAIGFVQSTVMVKANADESVIAQYLKMFYLSRVITSAIILFATLAYKERPPTPSSACSQRDPMKFGESLKLLWKNKYFFCLSQSYGIYFGLFVSIFILINPMITTKFPKGYEIDIGWMGFWNIMVAITSFVFVGVVLDKFHKYRITAILLNAFSLLFWLIFVIVLTTSAHFVTLYALFVAMGIFFVPYFAAGMEQAAEMTYPVSEETSSTVILILGNIYAFMFIYTLGIAAEAGYVNVVGYTIVGLYFVSTLFSIFAKTDLNRLNSEKNVVY